MANFNTNLKFQLLANAAQFNSEMKKSRQQLAGFGSSLKTFGSFAAGGFLANEFVQLTGEIINTRGEFEKLEGVLANTLGSNTGAAVQLEKLSTFARENNQNTRELADSYISLTNRGLRPTEKQLKSLLDLASASKKSFDQVSEAVLDAVVGENERLKELGIRAKDAGDRVQFTFRGITTEVEKSEGAIKDYIFSLGELEGVAGATEAANSGLTGQITAFNGSVQELRNELGKLVEKEGSATISFFTELTRSLTDFISLQNDSVSFSLRGIDTPDELSKKYDELLVTARQLQDELDRDPGFLSPQAKENVAMLEAKLRTVKETLAEINRRQADIIVSGINEEKAAKAAAEAKKQAEELKKQKEYQQQIANLEKERLSLLEKITIEAEAYTATMGTEISMTPGEALQIGRNEPFFSKDYLKDLKDSFAEGDKFKEVPETLGQITDGFRATSGALNSFTSDLTSGLLNGQNAFESFKDASIRSLKELAREMISTAILSTVLSAILPGAGGFGKIFSGLIGGGGINLGGAAANQRINLTGTLKASGNDLVTVLGRQQQKNSKLF